MDLLPRGGVLAALGVAVGTGLCAAAYAFGVEPGLRLRVTRYGLAPPGWPPGFRLRLGVVADLHAGEPHMGLDRVRRVVAAANALRPDAMLFLGDLNASHRFLSRRFRPDETAALLAELRAARHLRDPRQPRLAGGRRRAAGEPRAGRGAPGARSARHHRFGEHGAAAGEGRAALLAPRPRRPMGVVGRGVRRLHRGGVDDLTATLAAAEDNAPAILMAHEPDVFPESRPASRSR